MKAPLLRIIPVLFLFLVVIGGRGALAAADKAPQRLEKVRIAYSSVSGNQAPAWVAYEKGFFKKNGLDVELVYIEAGSKAVGALLSGDVAFAQMAGSSVIQSRLQDKDVVIVAGFLNTMDYQLMVHDGITRPEQLKGKSMAVSRFGSSSDFATRYALNKYGLAPDKDVAILEIGSQPARFAALEAGKIQGAMVTVPLTLKAKKMGFHPLADLQMLGLEYQHTALVTSRALIKSKPEVVRSALKAFVEAIHYYKTNRQEALAILGKYLKESDPEALEETYNAIGLALTPEKPYPTLRGIQIMLREIAAKDRKAEGVAPEQFVDTSFVKELDSSGYIDRLYKSQPLAAAGRERAPAPSMKKTESERPAPVLRAQSPRQQEYTVKAGDTLSKIAAEVYGSTQKWDKIFQANAATVKNPNYIFIGQKLAIPSDDGLQKG
jgi:NitT/TauT family transport system substrate-binding protein